MPTPTTDRLIEIHEIIGSKRRGIVGIIPQSKSKFYADVQKGVYELVRIGSRSYVRQSNVNRIIEGAGQ